MFHLQVLRCMKLSELDKKIDMGKSNLVLQQHFYLQNLYSSKNAMLYVVI